MEEKENGGQISEVSGNAGTSSGTPKIKKRTMFLNILAFYIVTLIFGYVAAITFLNVPESSTRFADQALVFFLGTVFAGIMVWAFRSSKAQMDKEAEELQLKSLNGKGGTSD